MENNKGISRRSFLGVGGVALAGATAAGLVGCAPKAVDDSAASVAGDSSQGGMPVAESGASAGPDVAGMHSWEIAPEPIASDQITSTEECDVLVIGAGLAGCCASLSALEKGAKVITIDKNPECVVARGVHVAGFHTKVQQKLAEQGLVEEPDYNHVVRRWINWAQGRVKEPLLWEFARKSGACFDWLYDLVTGDKNLEALLWDGYYKGPDYTEYPVTHIFYLADKYEETVNFTFYQGSGVGDVYGNAVLVPALYELIAENGGEIRWSTKSEQLIREDGGPVTGAIVTDPDGNYVQINAKSVIIASGDFAADNEMFQYYAPMTVYAMDGRYYNPPDCDTGDMHKQAIWIGGAMQKSEPYAAVMHLDFGAASYGFLHVNWEGKRFKNEDVNTQSKSVTKALQTHKDAWTIYDSHGLEQVKEQIDAGLGGGLQWGQLTQPVGGEYNLEAQKKVLEGEIADGLTVTADSLEELAEKMGVPAENLVATVDRYNELCDLGKDLDFGKRPEVMGKVQDPPFYAGKLVASMLTMCGGLRTNTEAQVLDAEDHPIEGLYVCGSAAGEFFGAGDYPTYVPGIGHGRCVTFGRIAGINAAGGNAEEEIPSLDI
ncbi:MAG TPA: FAD-dependent oxidoreductase [Slackia equolifaciens]|uniref:FAD-dependent oxidoreductase n=1 Tax=Slackia equolifaciens TaxID=498718 RepID=A0A9D3A1Z3_9ACTN|nr:FAD-dependent oxidoreductase [Slackia equolifaciens]